MAGLLLGACGSSDDDGGSATARDGAGDRHAAGAEPEATDPATVEPYVDDLLERHDRVVDQIIVDPGVAADPDDLLVGEYLSLYEPGSEFAQEVLDAWTANGAEGISVRPYDDQHPGNDTRLDGEIEVVSPDEVTAPFCLALRQITYRDGEVIEGIPLLEQRGEVVVVRVDGEWRLRRRELFDDQTGCREEREEES